MALLWLQQLHLVLDGSGRCPAKWSKYQKKNDQNLKISFKIYEFIILNPCFNRLWFKPTVLWTHSSMLSRWQKLDFISLKKFIFFWGNVVCIQGTNQKLWDVSLQCICSCSCSYNCPKGERVPAWIDDIYNWGEFELEQNFKQFQRSPNTLFSRTQWMPKGLRISNEEIKSELHQPRSDDFVNIVLLLST